MSANQERIERPKFFVAGGTMPTDSPGYLVRDADKKLYDALLNGRYCYVLNSRQMGKSSLSVRTMTKLNAAGVNTCFLDLTRFGSKTSTPEAWYAGMVNEAGRAFNLRTEFLQFYKNRAELTPVERFITAIIDLFLRKTDRPLVIFIDEIDATRALPFSADDFFAAIRSCYNRRATEPIYNRLSFCLLGVAVPSDLIQDTRITPINIGERIYLKDFTLEEIRPFGQGLGANGQEIAERIHFWTNGHPFLTQSLCLIASREEELSEAGIDRIVQELFLDQSQRESNINLADVGNRILNGNLADESIEQYRSDILSLYLKVYRGKSRVFDDESNRHNAVLKLSGVLRTEGKELKIRNRIYRRVFDEKWVKDNLPNQEILRQRRAYQKGVIRATAVAALILLCFIGLAAKIYQESLVAQKNADQALKQERKARLLVGQREKALNAVKQSNERENAARILADQSASNALKEQKLAQLSALESKKETMAALQATERAKLSAKQAELAKLAADNNSLSAYYATIAGIGNALDSGQTSFAWDLLDKVKKNVHRDWLYNFYLSQVFHADQPYCISPGAIEGLETSEDGKFAYAGDAQGGLQCFELASGKVDWHRSFSKINCLALSQDGQRLFFATDHDSLYCVSAMSGQTIWHTRYPREQIVQIELDNGQNCLVACDEGQIISTYSMKTGELIKFQAYPGFCGGFDADPAFRCCYVLDAHGNIQKVNPISFQPIGKAIVSSFGTPNSIAVSSDGSAFAFTTNFWNLEIFSDRTQKRINGEPLMNAAENVSFSPTTDSWFVTESDGSAQVFTGSGGSLIRTLTPARSTLTALCLNVPNGYALAGSPTGKVYKFAVDSGISPTKRLFIGKSSSPYAVNEATHRIAKLLNLAVKDPKGVQKIFFDCEVLDLNTGKKLWIRSFSQTPQADGSAIVHWSPKGKRLLISFLDKAGTKLHVVIINGSNGKAIESFSTWQSGSPSWLGRNHITVGGVEDGVYDLKAHRYAWTHKLSNVVARGDAVATPNHKYIVMQTTDFRLECVRALTGRVVWQKRTILQVFEPGGAFDVVNNDEVATENYAGAIVLINIPTGRIIGQSQPITHSYDIQAIGLSPNGRELLCSLPANLVILNRKTLKEIAKVSSPYIFTNMAAGGLTSQIGDEFLDLFSLLDERERVQLAYEQKMQKRYLKQFAILSHERSERNYTYQRKYAQWIREIRELQGHLTKPDLRQWLGNGKWERIQNPVILDKILYVAMQSGRFKLAENICERASYMYRSIPSSTYEEPSMLAQNQCLLCLYLGNSAGFSKAVPNMLKTTTQNPNPAYEDNLLLLAQFLAFFDRNNAPQLAPCINGTSQFVVNVAVREYSCGYFRKCVGTTQSSLINAQDPMALPYRILRAMAEYKLGEHKAAFALLQKCDAQRKTLYQQLIMQSGGWPNWVIEELFYEKARETLGMKPIHNLSLEIPK